MMRVRLSVAAAVFGLFAGSFVAAPVEAQGPDGRWPLQPSTGVNRVVAPFMEGWYENPDGTYTISFGYLNMNDSVVEIPLGEDNFIEPAQFDGMQPTYFERGHPRGVFTVTLPASMRDTDVWWNIRGPSGELARVPGRTNAHAYQLDWNPRPHGTVPPRVSFEGQDGEGYGPPGLVQERVLQGRVGERVELSIMARDISERDESDPRFRETIPINVEWVKHQGPVGSEVEYERHESNPLPEPDPDDDDDDAGGRGGRGSSPPPPERIRLNEAAGTASVYAIFSMPGEYVMRAQVDQFGAPDSSSGDQCCWTNGYVRVNVTE